MTTTNMVITEKSDNIKIAGHRGRWYVCAVYEHKGCEVFELEHEKYGDEAAHLLVDSNGIILLDDVWNGIDDLIESEL
ncbi:MAG: hypothetical protein A2Y15_05945 [Clostridiales bacterium GWF2_36_10]|nr:MAG: hypothetical protein A2Y15_05945 [Clostridiales bacterium GWF2_36_10]HAN21600.1 hypothetical protein [Clostridiales bacterium]